MTEHEHDDSSDELELVMPFVTVRSKGGPHDDESYSCGWEMGALDELLEHRAPAVHTQLIHAANQPQADLIAMKNGYRPDFTPAADGWVSLTATRTEGP